MVKGDVVLPFSNASYASAMASAGTPVSVAVKSQSVPREAYIEAHALGRTEALEEGCPGAIHRAGIAAVALLQLLEVGAGRAIKERVLEFGQRYRLRMRWILGPTCALYKTYACRAKQARRAAALCKRKKG